MSSLSSLRLLDVEPDLAALLAPEERELAAQVAVPLVTVAAGELISTGLLAWERAFGAIVVEGMIMHRIVIGEHPALRLLGPGDMFILDTPGPAILVDGGYRVAGSADLAVLEDHMLVAIRRFPQLAVALQRRMADQQERLAAQLVACQLPRVEDRLLAMMWLLAESWGRVTTSGTALPISLTHDALGELIGAKRPTVTLALRELTERGALLRTDQGWLLLEQLDQAQEGPPIARPPSVVSPAQSSWAAAEAETAALMGNAGLVSAVDPEIASGTGSLRETLDALRESHLREAARYAAGLQSTDQARARSREIRERIRRERQRRRAPS